MDVKVGLDFRLRKSAIRALDRHRENLRLRRDCKAEFSHAPSSSADADGIGLPEGLGN